MTAQASLPTAVDSFLTRDMVLKHLADMLKLDGQLTRDTMEAACVHLGVTPRQVQRLLHQYLKSGTVTPTTGGSFETRPIENVFLAQVAYFRHCGNAVKAWEEMQAHGMCLDMSLRTFQRRVNEWEAWLRAAAKGGYRAMVKHQLFNTEHIPFRGFAYGMDHTKLSIRIAPEQGTKYVFPWLTFVLDLKTRYLLSWIITESDPITEDNVSVLIEAIMGEEIEGRFVGGKPQFLRTDRGADFVSNVMTRGLLALDIDRQFTEPYSSWQNGRVERLNGTIDCDFAPTTPGFYQGGEDEYTRRVLKVNLPDNALITREALDQRFAVWAKNYNNTPHRALNGLTPLQAWMTDEHPVVKADEDVLRKAMQRSDKRKVHHYGIEHRGRIYLNPRLRRDDALGQWVEVRYHEHHTHKVEVFVDGEYVCTAFESHAMSQGMQLGVVATRRADRDKFTVLKRAADYQNALDERQRQIQAGVRESKLPTLPSLSEVDLAAINDEGVDLSTFLGQDDADPVSDTEADAAPPAVPDHSRTGIPQAAQPSRIANLTAMLKEQNNDK